MSQPEEFESEVASGRGDESHFDDAFVAASLQPTSAGGDSGGHLDVQSTGHPSGSAAEAEQYATQDVTQVQPTQVAEPSHSGSDQRRDRKGKGKAVASSGHASSGAGSTARADDDNSQHNPSLQPALSDAPPSDYYVPYSNNDTFGSVIGQLEDDHDYELEQYYWEDPGMPVMRTVAEADEGGGAQSYPISRTSQWVSNLHANQGRPEDPEFISYSDPSQRSQREPSTFLQEGSEDQREEQSREEQLRENQLREQLRVELQRRQQESLMHKLSEGTFSWDEKWIDGGKGRLLSLNSLDPPDAREGASQPELQHIKDNIRKHWKCVQKKIKYYEEKVYTNEQALNRLGEDRARLVSEWVEKYRDYEGRYEDETGWVKEQLTRITKTVTSEQKTRLQSAVPFVHDLHDYPKDTNGAIMNCKCVVPRQLERRKVKRT